MRSSAEHRRSVRRWPLILVALASMGLSGCAVLLVGAGVAGGYAISKDSVRNLFNLPQERVYDKSLAVAAQMGLVTVQDRAHGLIKAKVQDANVTITVKPVTKRTVELKVKARNDLLFPKVDIAQEVYSKVVEGL